MHDNCYKWENITMEVSNVNTHPRSSNVELLRIFCMYFIIMHHCIIHGGGYAMENCANKFIGMLVLPAGKVGFDCFVAISAFFLVDSKFKTTRAIRIWTEVLFYNITFVGMTALLGSGYADPITWRTWFGAFFPIIGNSHGYVASYIVFYLLTPFLAVVKSKLTKRDTIYLLGILFLIQVFSSILGKVDYYTQPISSEVQLFVLFYFIAFYIKKWEPSFSKSKLLLGGTLLFGYGLTAIGWIGQAFFPEYSRIFNFIIGNTGNESSLNNILAGWALFLLAQKWKVPINLWINKLASFTLGILLIHDSNFFRPVVWHRFVKAEQWYYVSSGMFVWLLITYSAAVFLAGAAIDYVRQETVEKYFIHSKLYEVICCKLEKFIQIKNMCTKE